MLLSNLSAFLRVLSGFAVPFLFPSPLDYLTRLQSCRLFSVMMRVVLLAE
jgi:hypothetical protein